MVKMPASKCATIIGTCSVSRPDWDGNLLAGEWESSCVSRQTPRGRSVSNGRSGCFSVRSRTVPMYGCLQCTGICTGLAYLHAQNIVKNFTSSGTPLTTCFYRYMAILKE